MAQNYISIKQVIYSVIGPLYYILRVLGASINDISNMEILLQKVRIFTSIYSTIIIHKFTEMFL